MHTSCRLVAARLTNLEPGMQEVCSYRGGRRYAALLEPCFHGHFHQLEARLTPNTGHAGATHCANLRQHGQWHW